MNFFSNVDGEFGIIAVGERPFGVIAIGMMPLGFLAIGMMPRGVIAIGILSVGVFTLACGASAGLVTAVCGVGSGLVSFGCGVGMGLKTGVIGGNIQFLPKDPSSGAKWWLRAILGTMLTWAILIYVWHNIPNFQPT